MFQKTRFFIKTLAVAAFVCCGAAELGAGTLTGTFSPIAADANLDLTVDGKLDWVHWGLYTDTSLDRKAQVTPQITDFTALGADTNFYTFIFQYSDNNNGYSWSDGNPASNVTNTTTGVWAYNFAPVGGGFQFTVPANTSTHTLKVYVGGFNASGRITASLSDGSASSYTDTQIFNFVNRGSGVYTINFAADSSNQTLTITWILSTPLGQTPNVTLQAAALTATAANNPPFAVISSPTNGANFAAPANIVFTSAAFDADGSVSKVEYLEGANKLGEGAGGDYNFTWSSPPVGLHTITAKVTDNVGAFRSSPPVDVFVHTSSGTLAGSFVSPPTAVNLTVEGTADWAHWGLTASNSFNHKSGVVQKISDTTRRGTNTVQRFTNNYTAFTWTDGTPTAAAANTPTGIFITGYVNGFRLTVPADATTRQLKLYVGGYGTRGLFQAYLSDGSAASYNDASLDDVYSNLYGVYTLAFAAASAGQQLIINYTSAAAYDFDYGNVTLQAATLQGGPSEPLPVQIINPMRIGSDFVLSFVTQFNHNYLVEYAGSLPPSWTTLTNLPGTGAIVSVTNRSAGPDKRFYRVQTQ